MANHDDAAHEPIKTLYGPAVRASIQRGNLADLKTVLADAEAANKKNGDIRSALAVAQIALRKLSS
jgi:hypothetical protein